MRSPLAPREGISANRLRAPGGTQTHAAAHLPVPASVGDWLALTFPHAAAHELVWLVSPDGSSMVDETGQRVALDDAVVPGGFYFFHRPVPQEPRVPFEISIVAEDDDLLVIDKPAFLASTPNGRFVRECAVTRLRVERGEPELVAIHRLDRVTSGLLVLSRRPQTRGVYQRMFQERRVQKAYRAMSVLPQGFNPQQFPLARHSRLDKEAGTRAMLEVAGEPNAISHISFAGRAEVLAASGAELGIFDLVPVTGKTHQLRVHMNAIGLPIFGDPVYPVDLAPDPYDFSSPLRLLASSITFTDPLSGQPREFSTHMRVEDIRSEGVG